MLSMPPSRATDLAAVRALLGELDARADALMRAERIDGLARERRVLADVGYVGQSHFIEVPLDLDAADPLAALYAAFESAHERINGHKTGSPAKIVNLRTVHIARLPKVALGGTPGATPGQSQKTLRLGAFSGPASGLQNRHPRPGQARRRRNHSRSGGDRAGGFDHPAATRLARQSCRRRGAADGEERMTKLVPGRHSIQ